MTLRQGGPQDNRQSGPQHQDPNRTGAPRAGRKLGLGPNTGPARWVLALAVFGAVMGASLGLKGVLVDFSWFPRAAVVVAATLLLPALMRRRPGLGPFAPLGALAGWIMGLTLMFFPTTAVLGFIPTSGTVQAALDMASEASSVIMGTLAPAPAVLPMYFLISAGLGFTALLIDTLAVTVAMPAASAFGLVLVMLPSALMTKTGLGTLGFIGAASGFLLVLGCCRWYAPEGRLRVEFRSVPSGTLPRAVAMGAAVVLAMSLIPTVLPGFNEGAFPQGSRFNDRVGAARLDPMISLGDSLREQSGQVHLTYLSNTNTAQYLRMNTLEDFTGKQWRPSPLPTGLEPGLDSLSPAQAASPDIPRTSTLTVITPRGLESDWLPIPAGTVQVTQLGGNWRWNPATATIKGAGSTTPRNPYTVGSELPDLTPGLLAAASGPPRPGLDPVFTELPKDVPKLVNETAHKVAGAAGTPYGKAMALQDYLRSNAFTYSLDTPVDEGYDGSGMEVLAAFLKVKSGYCVHFSAAMAVMARELGIPSRIAVGYAPGAENLETAERDGIDLFGYQATGRDAHAWPELYFEGAGWVAFEPTPSRGSVPDYAEDVAAPAPAPGDLPELQSNAAAEPTATSSASTAAAGPGSAEQDAGSARWLPTTGLVLLILLLLASPALARSNVRRRRLARVRTPADAVAGTDGLAGADVVAGSRDVPELVAWRELMDSAIDYGYVRDPALTPALQKKQIAGMLGPTEPAGLALLLHAYEGAVYGAAPAGSGQAPAPADAGRGTAGPGTAGRDDLADAVETVTARLRTRATAWGRLRATWVPPSFFRR